MTVEKPFVSRRAVEEQQKEYKYRRFDRYIDEAGPDRVKRAIAITAFKEEIDYLTEVERTPSNE